MHSLVYIRMLFFRPSLNIFIFVLLSLIVAYDISVLVKKKEFIMIPFAVYSSSFLSVLYMYTVPFRPIPIVLVKCWKVPHWNAKKLLKNCQKSKKLLPKFQKLLPKFLAIFI